MANVLDVAQYILSVRGPMTAMKLQKLVYYAQAWSLVWDDDALFDEEIEAWANGPVVRKLYDQHRGSYRVASIPAGKPDSLSDNQKDTVDKVLEFYGGKSPQWLSDLTHDEDPWRIARGNLADGVRGDAVITKESLAEYYGSL